MILLLSVFGIALGIATAFAIHYLFTRLRQKASLPAVIAGWIVTAIATFFAVSFAYTDFVVNKNPHASMGPLAGFLALMFFLLMGICGLVGLLHARKFQLPWSKAFALLMAESGAVFLAVVALSMLYYPIAHILQGGNRNPQEILPTYTQTSQIIGLATNALIGALVALEVIRPLISKRTTPAN